jgi:hypothetical protein
MINTYSLYKAGKKEFYFGLSIWTIRSVHTKFLRKTTTGEQSRLHLAIFPYFLRDQMHVAHVTWFSLQFQPRMNGNYTTYEVLIFHPLESGFLNHLSKLFLQRYKSLSHSPVL